MAKVKKTDIKKEYEAMTLGEVRGIYEEKLRVQENRKGLITRDAEAIAKLDYSKAYNFNRAKDLGDSIKSRAKDAEEEAVVLEVIKAVLDKKEAEGLDQAAYEKYMADNKDNIKLLLHRVNEMQAEALAKNKVGTGWKDWTPALIKMAHDAMLKELIFMLKDKAGDIVEISRLDYNPNKGMDGRIVGSKGIVSIDTILAGGYNIQRLHYRTLIYKY